MLSALAGCAVGVTMIVVDDVRWPIWDSLLDAVWSPTAGGLVVLTSLFALVITAVSSRDSRQDEPAQEAVSAQS